MNAMLPESLTVYSRLVDTILAVKLKMINQDRMIFGDFSVNFREILQRLFSIKILTGEKNFAKLYLIFQKLDHLPLIEF